MAEKTPEEIALERIAETIKTQADEIDLSNLNLANIPTEIKKLTNISSIKLNNNQLTDLPVEIFDLSNLHTLDLTDNQLTMFPLEMCSLARLKKLLLGFNKLKVLPREIECLKSLTYLSIRNNNIDILPTEIGTLSNLESLDLDGNQISQLPSNISGLKKLSYFSVRNNNLVELPTEIGEVENLEIIFLSDNSLKTLPIELSLLKNLRVLSYSNNEISQFPESIFKIKNIVVLLAVSNNISDVPQEITELSNIEIIMLGGTLQSDVQHFILGQSQSLSMHDLIDLKTKNAITSLPDQLEKLNKLKYLCLSHNKISVLSQGIRSIKSLELLDIEDNNLLIPPEITNTLDPHKIFNYYFGQLKKPLNEVKLVFIGQGSVGKTSIISRILYEIFEQKQTKTEGITINKWQVADITLNIWDFGGQEIMHATHQFFLTKRSLYLLVLDSRLTQEENRVEYWLKIIQSFGGESPVLIVGNKIDQHPLDIDRTGLQKKYFNIVGILETSAATGAGIEELKTAITKQVNNLPHVRDLLPETWFTVKTKLEGLGRESNFITHDKYLELCAENEVSDETSQRTLIGFLHDLGVVLHFQDDPRLEALGILNPQWVTNGVYKILNSHTLFQNKGVLTMSMLDEILNLPEYPRGKRFFIVDMMKKFELCYDIEADKTFLVPDLLPKDEPQLNFNGIPAFEYAYPVLPSSIITRFIVRTNQHIHDDFVWRTGVLLKIGGNTALIKADIEDRKITIAIEGLEHTRRDALSAIRYQLDEIHDSIKGLDPQKKVPVPNAPKAEPLKYEYLLKLERAGQESLLVENGNDLVTVNVRQMLSAIETEAQRKESGGTVTNIYIGGNVEGSNIVSGNNNVVMQRIQDSFNKAEGADIQAELKATLKQLADAVAVMTKSLSAEQAAEVTDDLSKLVDEATKPTPSKKWYSVSIDGLIKAAENVEKVGEPVINLSRKVLSLLTGGVIK